MKKNNFNPEKPVSLWQKCVGYLNIALLVGQLGLPTLAQAFTAFDAHQAAVELNADPAFTKVSNSDSQFVKSEYVVESSQARSAQTIEAFHAKLVKHKKSGLNPPIYIPIVNSRVNVIFPHYKLPKRVGDRFVQSRMVRSQIYNQLNRTLISSSYTNETQQINDLYNNAYEFAGSTATKFGDKVTASNLKSFNKNFIWPELQIINGEQVLVPVVHLTQSTIDNQRVDGHVAEFGGSRAEFRSITIKSGTLTTQHDTFVRTAKDLTVMPKAEIRADGDLNLFVGGTLQNLSGRLSATQNVDIVAGQYVQKTVLHRYNTAYGQGTRLGQIASVDGHNIRIHSYGDLIVQGGEITGNTIGLRADGNIRLISQQTTYSSNKEYKGFKESASEIEHLTTKLSAKDSIYLMASGAIELKAAELHADQGVIELLAGQGIFIGNEFNKIEKTTNKKWGKTTEQEQVLQTAAIRSALHAGKGILIASDYGDVTLQATKLTSGSGTEINAYNGRVNLLLAKEQDHYFYNKVKKGTWKIKTETKQDQVDTAVYNEVIGGVKVHASHGITLELGQYDGELVEDVISEFRGKENLEWMADLYDENRFKNNLKIVSTELLKIHEHKKTSNLSPAAMAVIAIAVSVAMGPAGTGWIGSGANAIGPAFNGLVSGSAMQAGAITLATQAATGLASGKGIDGTIKSMLESDNLRALATSMVTAGVLNSETFKSLEFFNSANLTNVAEQSQTAISIANQASQALLNATASAAISTIIDGGDLGDFKGQILGNLTSYAIAELGKQLASEIGDAVHSDPPKINQVTRYLAHAGVGCLTGTLTAAASNSDKGLGCSSGAGGAVVGELVADAHKEISGYSDLEKELKDKDKKLQQLLGVEGIEDINNLTPAQMQTLEDNLMVLGNLDYSKAKLMQLQSEGVDIAKLGAGLAAFIAGGEVNIAANAGANAAENNGFWFVLQGAYLLWKAYDAIEAARKVIAIGKRLNKVKNLPAGQQAAARNELIMELGFTLLGDVVLGQAPEQVFKAIKKLANKTKIGAELSLQLDQVIDSIERKVEFKVAGYAPANYNNPDQTAPGGFSDKGIKGHDTLKKSVIPKDKYTPAEWSLLKHNAKAHTVERHGPHVTDEHLKHRASTGVTPDGKDMGNPPPLSSKFGSDAALKESLQKAAPTGDLFQQALALDNGIEASKGSIKISFDAGKSMGHGYKKVNGQMKKVSNLTKVVVHYRQDNNGVWYINTMYPSNKGVSPVDKG
ncbi:DUF637 domain-containing protein [Pseudoalteromonas sp. R3]|uniref:DUF637 domain-containing protein n=1 Tax=Pseudoalteromonas sp. R3 TaxID=1709477 RepID=UPI0006B58881|nr:DUF637 domain-containing protein [Pseudoalteromonas sp. R3]AZZ96361.1 hypothetical protein ELR70_04000 [Pseudoalteromonas sp. R3]